MDSPNCAIPEKNKPGQSFPFDACNMCHKFDASNKKQHTQFMYMALRFWDIRMKKMKERIKISNLMVDHFSLTFVNLLLA